MLSSKSTQIEARTLHATVDMRSKAKQALNRIDMEKENFERAWLEYSERLSDLLAQQLQEREKTLSAFDEQRRSWEIQLTEATQSLQRANQDNLIVLDDDDMDVKDDAGGASPSEPPKQELRGALILAKQAQLAQQLQEVTQALAPKRDGSRTPRRTKQEKLEKAEVDKADKSDTNVGKDNTKDGKPPPG